MFTMNIFNVILYNIVIGDKHVSEGNFTGTPRWYSWYAPRVIDGFRQSLVLLHRPWTPTIGDEKI